MRSAIVAVLLVLSACATADKAARIVDDVDARYASLVKTTEQVQAVVEEIHARLPEYRATAEKVKAAIDENLPRYEAVMTRVRSVEDMLREKAGKLDDLREQMHEKGVSGVSEGDVRKILKDVATTPRFWTYFKDPEFWLLIASFVLGVPLSKKIGTRFRKGPPDVARAEADGVSSRRNRQPE